MNEKNIVVCSLDDELEDRTDWERVKNLTDEEIEQAVLKAYVRHQKQRRHESQSST